MMYYPIDGKIYYLNLNAIFSLVSETPKREKIVNTTITQYYTASDSDVEPNNGKEIVEAKSNLNDTMNNIRYDLVKNIINCLLTSQYDSDGIPAGIKHLNEMSFAQGLCFNTLIEHKILIEIENSNG